MSTFRSDAHDALQLADENHVISERLERLQVASPRWVATIAFYSAVHYVGAYFLETYSVEIGSHRHRSRLLAGEPSMEPIRASYQRLYMVSLDARYNPQAVISDELVQLLLEVDLKAVRSLINRELER